VNLQYSYTKPTTKQLSPSFSIFPKNNLRLYGIGHYNLIQKSVTKFGIGADFFTCCLNFRVTWEQERKLLSLTNTGPTKKYNNKFGFQLVFVGFSEMKIKNLTGSPIPGDNLPPYYN